MTIILTILASVLVFGAIIFIHELGHFLTAKLSKIKVNEFAMGMGPKIVSFKKKETTYSLRLFPIGGFVSMEGEDEESDAEGSFTKAKLRNRILVIMAGAIMNLVLGFSVLLGLTISKDYITTRTISKFEENAITQQTGLQVDDTLLAINGRNLYVVDDLFYELMRVKDGKADVLVRRGGEEVLLKNVQFQIQEYEDGSSGLMPDFKVYAQQKTFGAVMKESALWTVSIARQIFLSLVDLVKGNVAINQLSGPVGIISVISEATTIGWSSVLMILAFISINLGVFNLLPLPALDGGRMVFLLIEGVTRKKFPQKYESIVHLVGIILLFALMLFVTYNDVSKLFTG